MTDLSSAGCIPVRRFGVQGAVPVATGQSGVRDLLQCVHVHRGAVREIHHRRAAPSSGPARQRRRREPRRRRPFCRQEAQHAAAHRKHMIALDRAVPGLEQCYEQTTASFNDLIDAHPVEFHAAYIANLEATFTPMFKVILDHRDSLFAGGDNRVASLMMWHFVEEIEHRSSGLLLYRHLMPDPWYRVKQHPPDIPPRRLHRGDGRQGLRRTHSVRRPRRLGAGGDVVGAAPRVPLSGCAGG